VIDANPGLKQAELARAVRLDRSTVVSTIDKLERRKLVQRKRVKDDRRTNALVLTEAGRELLHRLIPKVDAHEKHLTEQLTGQELDTLFRLLAKVCPQQ
jgi:DNA-binding MarR family transcriptional regulator